jgi:hypothetical protein
MDVSSARLLYVAVLSGDHIDAGLPRVALVFHQHTHGTLEHCSLGYTSYLRSYLQSIADVCVLTAVLCSERSVVLWVQYNFFVLTKTYYNNVGYTCYPTCRNKPTKPS